MTDDDDILAGEYALGLLSPDEAIATEARFPVDAVLSARAQWWREHLTSFAEDAATAPSPEVWRRIEARLASNDNNLRQSVRRWRWATGAAAMAAAVLGIVALRPEQQVAPLPQPTVVAAPLVASLSGKGGAAVAISYSATEGRMLVTPVALDAGTGDAELWIIPVGRTVPVAVGVIDADHSTRRTIDPRQAALMLVGATLAISREPKGGSPSGSPTGPIVATGKIIRV